MSQEQGLPVYHPDGGSDDVFIHQKELAVEGLQEVDTEPYDTRYDDRKGKCMASNCCDSQYPDRYVISQRHVRDKMRGRLSGRASLPSTRCHLW